MDTTTRQISRYDIEHLPHYRKKTAHEYSSTCPFCLDGGGKDRFLYWPDKGNYLCRQCGAKGFVVDAPGSLMAIDPAQYEAWQRAEVERKRQERQSQLSAMEQVARSGNADRYHRLMIDRSYWYGQGLSNATIDKFNLGWCPACPTCQASPSHTIPVYYHGRLVSIRHRLAQPPTPGDKYRPEMAGLPAAIFNADILDKPDWMTVIVEGEVKAMVLSQYDLPALALPGAATFKEKWVRLFEKCRKIYVALDPGADDKARRIGELLARAGRDTSEVRLCDLPDKPDDMIVKYHATAADLFKFLMLGEKL